MTTPEETKAPQHTPGPWHVSPIRKGYVFSEEILDAQEGPIGFCTYGTDGEATANARLIAAAPALLAALREFIAIQETPAHRINPVERANQLRRLVTTARTALALVHGREGD